MKAVLQNVRQYMVDAMFKSVQWDEERCNGCLTCYEVCPVGCCLPDPEAKAILPPDRDRCVACSACVLQCPEQALELA